MKKEGEREYYLYMNEDEKLTVKGVVIEGEVVKAGRAKVTTEGEEVVECSVEVDKVGSQDAHGAATVILAGDVDEGYLTLGERVRLFGDLYQKTVIDDETMRGSTFAHFRTREYRG